MVESFRDEGMSFNQAERLMQRFEAVAVMEFRGCRSRIQTCAVVAGFGPNKSELQFSIFLARLLQHGYHYQVSDQVISTLIDVQLRITVVAEWQLN